MVDLMDLNVALGHFYNWSLISMEILSVSVIIAYWSDTIDHNFSCYYFIWIASYSVVWCIASTFTLFSVKYYIKSLIFNTLWRKSVIYLRQIL